AGGSDDRGEMGDRLWGVAMAGPTFETQESESTVPPGGECRRFCLIYPGSRPAHTSAPAGLLAAVLKHRACPETRNGRMRGPGSTARERPALTLRRDSASSAARGQLRF